MITQEVPGSLKLDIASTDERVTPLDVRALIDAKDTELAEARRVSTELGQQMLNVNAENASLRGQLQEVVGARNYLGQLVLEVSGNLARLQDALRSMAQQGRSGT